MNDTIVRASRIRFILISAVVAVSLLGDALLYALLPAKPEAFGVRVWQIGVLLAANRFVRLITNELAGRWIQRRKGNTPLLLALLVGSVITCSYALPLGFWWLLFARMLWGACWSVLRVEGYLSALGYASDRNRGQIFAVYHAVARLGQGGGLLIGGFLSDLIGIPWTFLLFGLCGCCGIMLVLRTPSLPVKVAPEKTGRQTASSSVRWPLALWSCALCITMAEEMVANLTGSFVAQRIGPQIPIAMGIAALSGLLLSFRSFASLLLGPLVGALSDRLGRKTLLIVFMVLQSLCVAGLALIASWRLLIACMLLQFAFALSSRLLVYTMAGDTAPEHGQALHMSRFVTFTDLGTALAPVVAFAVFAGYGFLFVAILVWLLLALVLALLLSMK